jgi:hypothetical protein
MLKRGRNTLLAVLAATAAIAALSAAPVQAASAPSGVHSPGSAAARMYWPSTILSQYTGIKAGQSLTVTGEKFPANSTVTLYQCNGGALGSPEGVINSSTCDMKNTVTGTTNAKGVITETITVDPKGSVAAKSGFRIYINHGRLPAVRAGRPETSGGCGCWGWGIGTSTPVSATLVANPTETWLSPQTVKVTGYHIPVPAQGTAADYLEECNPNVLSGDTNACDTADASTISVKTNGRATGSLPVVTGTVGDGTCGSGTGNFEVCYLVVGNASGIVSTTPIDFYL